MSEPVDISDNLKLALDKLGEPATIAEQTRQIRMLIYGDWGNGKTTLAALIAHVITKYIGGKICMITTDSNWAVINKFPEVAQNIVRYPFQDYTQIKAICKAHSKGLEPYKNFSVMIVDTISTAADKELRQMVKSKQYEDQKAKGPNGTPGWTHYQLLKQRTSDVMDVLNETDMSFICLTHLREPNEKDIENRKRAIRSNIPESTYEKIAQEVQAIGWLYREAKGSKPMIQFEPTTTEKAKSQIPTIEQKTYQVEEIPNLIEEWLKQ